MAGQLVIVESPSKAKTINKYLGAGFRVEASYGHIRDLVKGDDAVDVEHGFAMTYEVSPDKKERVAKLRKAAKEAEIVWLATDKDREGEAIAWHLSEALALPADKARRVTFNEITKKAIQAAFARPGNVDMDKVAAQEARRALDRLVGFRISPLLWQKVPGAKSAGRVQTVAVRLIVEREREIRAFRTADYWRVGAVLAKAGDSPAAKAAYATFLTAHRAAMEELADQAAEATAEKSESAEATDSAEPAVAGAAKKELEALLRRTKAFRAELVQYEGDRIATTAEAVKQARDEAGTSSAARRIRILDAEASRRIAAELRGSDFRVLSVEKKERQDRPRPPFTTASLQQAASTQLRFGTGKTMSLAQRLYEGVELGEEGSVALITYMRTDSTYLSDDAIREGRDTIGKLFGKDAVPDKPNHYAPRADAQGAHEAIRPTEPARTPDSLAGKLDRDLLALYRLIWTRFIACQMKPAVWNVTEVEIAAGPGGKARLRASGRELKSPGYTLLTGVSEDAGQLLPALAAQEKLDDVDVRETRHSTQPPPRFTEAGLVKELERQGIGRPSTYASIIETIQDRNYARIEERKFRPTFLGEVVVDSLIGHIPGTFDVDFTRRMEGELDEVESRKRDRVEVLDEFWAPFIKAVETAKKDMPRFAGRPSEYKCEKCGADMQYRLNKTGLPFLGCSKYPECDNRRSVDDEGRPKAAAQITEQKCTKCGKPMALRTAVRGKRVGHFLGCTGYPECSSTIPCDEDGNPQKPLTPEVLAALDPKCPDCGKPMALKRGRGVFLGCTGFPECKKIESLPAGYYVPRPEVELTKVLCDKCGKPLAVRDARGRKFLGCTGYPKCRNAKPYSLHESGYEGVAPRDVPREDRAAKESDGEAEDTDTTAEETEAAAPKKAAKKAVRKSAKAAAKPVADEAGDESEGAPAAPRAKAATKKAVKKTAKTAAKSAAKAKPGSDDGEAGSGGSEATGAEGGFPAGSGGSSAGGDAPFDADGFEPAGTSAAPAASRAAKSAPRAAAKPATATAAKPGGLQPAGKFDPDNGEWGDCPVCGKRLAVKAGKWGPFLSCTGFPSCRTLVNLKGDAKAKAALAIGQTPAPRRDPPVKTEIPCTECGSSMVIRTGRTGKFLGCGSYPKCKATQPLPAELEAAAEAKG